MSEHSQATSYFQLNSETLRQKTIRSLVLEVEHEKTVSSLELRDP